MTALLRIDTVSERIGLKRTAIYERIKDSLLPKAIKLGPRASVWPDDEINACNDAIIKGKSNDEIRALVSQLHAKRSN